MLSYNVHFSLLFLGKGCHCLQSGNVKGIFKARGNPKQHGACADLYFYISSYSGSHTTDSIEVKKEANFSQQNT